MATEGRNLSEYNKDFVPYGADFKVGIVVSEWNDAITLNLLKGAKDGQKVIARIVSWEESNLSCSF